MKSCWFLVGLFALVCPVQGFVGLSKLLTIPRCPQSKCSSRLGLRMGLETIEFKIFPDGRVEETVTGVKGTDCYEITKEIEKLLGQVVSTTPTSERYEEKVVLKNEVTEDISSSTSTSSESENWKQF